MLRYGKQSPSSDEASPDKLNRERMVEKAAAKFIRKLELMVESKLPKEHILASAAQYGLETADYSKKISDYLGIVSPAPETVSKSQKPTHKKSESKKEAKTEEVVAKQLESSEAE